MGQVLQAGVGQAPARQAALKAGPPRHDQRDDDQPRLRLGPQGDHARRRRRSGPATPRSSIAGGMESMNGAPYLLPGRPLRLSPRQRRARSTRPSTTACGAPSRTATWAPTPSASRSRTHVSREDQDAFALRQPPEGDRRHRRRPLRRRDGAGHRPRREGPRDGRRRSTRARAATRPPRRSPGSSRSSPCPTARTAATRPSGTVTAGNAPGITDGAAATVVASERAVERLGLKPLARIVGYAQAEVAPKWLFLAPVEGVRRLLDRIELPIEAFDLIEINEAFAAQTLADGRELGFDWDKVNVNGGAIALGHPIGASGARIVATLLHELRPARGPLRARDAVPRRRRLGRDGLRARLTAASDDRRRPRASARRHTADAAGWRDLVAEVGDSTG